jgi:ABC-type amino acid transport substrate-binding protein
MISIQSVAVGHTSPLRSRGVKQAALAGVLALGGCIPQDPEGTLERVRAGTLRVGVGHNPPWTDLASGADPLGIEIELVEELADSLGATIQWRLGSEADCMPALERFELDLYVGGVPHDTAWSRRVALTRPHARSEAQDIVLAAPPGENAWIAFLDQWLHSRRQQHAASESIS